VQESKEQVERECRRLGDERDGMRRENEKMLQDRDRYWRQEIDRVNADHALDIVRLNK
jgi:hypothetical protein